MAFLLSGLVGKTGEVLAIDHDSVALATACNRADTHWQRGTTFTQSGLLDLPSSFGNVDAIVGRRVLMSSQGIGKTPSSGRHSRAQQGRPPAELITPTQPRAKQPATTATDLQPAPNPSTIALAATSLAYPATESTARSANAADTPKTPANTTGSG